MTAGTSYAALLRAVNLGSHNKVAMGDLRELLADLGFEAPRSLLQSGNLVFRAAGKTFASLERLLERETDALGGRGTGRNWNTVLKLASLT